MIETSPIVDPGAAPLPARSTGLREALRMAVGIVVGLVIVVGGAAGVVAIKRYGDYSVQYPAHLGAPDRIGALTRSTAPPQQAEAALMGAPEDFAAVYTDRSRRVFVTGRPVRLLVPERTLGDAMAKLPLRGRFPLGAGAVGGHVRCGSEASGAVVCGWADHGTSGLVRIVGCAPGEVPQWVGAVRGAMIVRG